MSPEVSWRLKCGMESFRIGIRIALLAALLSSGAAQTPFPDVAPCHWAADAVGEIAGEPDVSVEQAMASHYLAENSIHQVFEGLVCDSPEWSRAFIANEPAEWPSGVDLESFRLSLERLDLMGDTASAIVTVSVAAEDGRNLERSGQLELRFVDTQWLVEYRSLSTLGLPLFP